MESFILPFSLTLSANLRMPQSDRISESRNTTNQTTSYGRLELPLWDRTIGSGITSPQTWLPTAGIGHFPKSGESICRPSARESRRAIYFGQFCKHCLLDTSLQPQRCPFGDTQHIVMKRAPETPTFGSMGHCLGWKAYRLLLQCMRLSTTSSRGSQS